MFGERKGDVTDPAEVMRLVDAVVDHGGPDVLVHNAVTPGTLDQAQVAAEGRRARLGRRPPRRVHRRTRG